MILFSYRIQQFVNFDFNLVKIDPSKIDGGGGQHIAHHAATGVVVVKHTEEADVVVAASA